MDKPLKKHFSTSKKLVLGFLSLMLLGSILLSLPISSSNHLHTPIIDCIFTSTSSICVTGLVILDTGTHWSVFGKIIILLLIQTGGIGFMSLATFILLLTRKKITIQNRVILKDSYNFAQTGGIVRITKHILIFTFATELLGTVLLMFTFIPQLGVAKGIGTSIFHSISSFCNAGFDIMGNFSSLTSYVSSPYILIVTMFLIVVGGLGFFVMEDLLIKRKKLKALSFHSKLVLSATAILIFLAAILIFIFEYNNPNTLGSLSTIDKITQAFFNAITPRTAGFNTLHVTSLTGGTVLLLIILMFIGGSPGSTAGGIKTTTMSVLLITVYSWIRGRENINIFHKRITQNLLKKAIAIAVFTFILIIFYIFILSVTEDASMKDIVFEVFSAFGTVGLSMGITPMLSTTGKILLVTAMFIGRLGPLTIALALSRNTNTPEGTYQYPEGDLLLG
jgi:trk system potassium uptake protein TrkH